MSKIIKKTNVEKETELSAKSPVSGIDIIENSGILNKKVLDAKDKAKLVIEEAAKEADRIREDAKRLLSQVNNELEKARRDGYIKGREEGNASVAQMAIKLTALKEKFYTTAEPEMIKLVMMIAEKIIGRLVHENEAAIKSIVKQAVESSIGERIVVKLNPEDYKVILASEFEFKDMLDRSKRIAFKEDETISKGGCVVETEVGTIDARLETQLKAIKKALEL